MSACVYDQYLCKPPYCVRCGEITEICSLTILVIDDDDISHLLGHIAHLMRASYLAADLSEQHLQSGI